MDFSKFEFLIQIINQYKKGTPEFDHVLKHELTHVSLYEGVAKKFYKPMAAAVLLRFEKSLAEKQNCFQVQADVYRVFSQYVAQMIEEARKQNELIDGEENYAYQWEQVRRKKMKNAKEYVVSSALPHRNRVKENRKDISSKQENRRENIKKTTAVVAEIPLKQQKNGSETLAAAQKNVTVVRQNVDMSPKTDLMSSVLQMFENKYTKAHLVDSAHERENKNRQPVVSRNEKKTSQNKPAPEKKTLVAGKMERQQPVVSQNETETVKELPVSEVQKTVMGKTDKYYIDMIKRVFLKIANEFEWDKKADNILKNIKNRYEYLVSQSDDSALKKTKENETSK